MENTDFDIIPTIRSFCHRICQPAWAITRPDPSFHSLSYIYEGEGTYIVNSRKLQVQKGDLIYIPKGTVRQACASTSNPMRIYTVIFLLKNSQMEDTHLSVKTITHIGFDKNLIDSFSYLTKIWFSKEYGYRMLARSVFSEVLVRLTQSINSGSNPIFTDKRISAVKDYIASNLEEKISVKDLSALVNLNPIYLSSLFKSVPDILSGSILTVSGLIWLKA